MSQTRRWTGRLSPVGCASRRIASIGLALVMLFALAARPAAAQQLAQVPDDALVVLKIKGLQATSAKIAKFANDLGVGAMVPQLADPLKTLQDQMKITQGLNKDGDLLVAFINPATSGETPDKSMVILLPISDYKAFLGNFPDAQTEGDVSQVKMGNDPAPGFVASWGTYAALSPSKTIVSKKPTGGVKVTAAANKELDSKDVTLFANMIALRALLQPELAKNRDTLLAEVDDAMKKSPQSEKLAPIGHAVVGQALNVADAFLRDADAATVGIAFGDEGLKSTVIADFQPASYLGKTFGSVKNTSEPLLGGLPAGKYLFYAGSISDPAAASKLIADLVDPVAKEITAAGPDMQPINDYMTALKAYVAASKGNTIGVLAPSGALGQEALFQMDCIQKGDAPAMTEAYKKMAATSPELMKAFGMGDTMKSTYTPNAKTVDGVSFDSFSNTFTPDPQNPGQAQQAQMMAMMYGPGGMTQIFGAVGADKVMVASGLNDANLSAAIAAAKSGEAPLSALDPVKKVAAVLPTSRVLEWYVPVDEIVSTGLNYARQFGFAMPIQLPPDLPPLGGTVSTEGSTLKLDGYVPTPLVQSLVAAGMQAAMQMQGGGGAGGPPGGGAPPAPGGL